MYDTKMGGNELLQEAAALIKRGEVVAFPTETVYGLGADALNANAVKKIFAAKGRPADNPLIVHVAGIRQAKSVAEVSAEAEALLMKFSPGPLTLILPKKACVPQEVTGNINTVGVRIPDNDMALKLIRMAGRPIAAPSANTSARVSPTSAKHVYEDMQGKIPLILDGGECRVGIESTVLSLATDVPTILRPGAITAEILQAALPLVRTHTGEVKVAAAPGMKYAHYAPDVEECLMFCDLEQAKKRYDAVKYAGKRAVILLRHQNREKIGGRDFADMGQTGEEAAHRVFAILRECEKIYDTILIEELPDSGVYASVMNRLRKSTGGRFI